jgi:hypothetical protein
MTRLRKMMLEELERRNYSEGTTRCYQRAVADFARYFHRSPDQLRPEHAREYQAYLFRDRKLRATSVTQRLAALRFFFLKTLATLPPSGAELTEAIRSRCDQCYRDCSRFRHLGIRSVFSRLQSAL